MVGAAEGYTIRENAISITCPVLLYTSLPPSLSVSGSTGSVFIANASPLPISPEEKLVNRGYF